MSEFCDSARAELAVCAQLSKRHRNCKVLQVLLSNIALSLALTAATGSAEHFSVKVIK